MEQNKAWVKKYLTEEQQQKLAEIAQRSYSPEAAQKLAVWGENWTKEDQQRASQQWDAVFAELRRLTVERKDPTGVEGQMRGQSAWNFDLPLGNVEGLAL